MKGADGDAERYHKAHDDPSFQVEKRKGATLIPFSLIRSECLLNNLRI